MTGSDNMWTCPTCHQQFYNRNQAHSCGTYSVEGFLAGKSEHSIALFRAFLNAYKQIGPYTLHPVKTRVALLTQMRFASVNKLGRDFLDGHLVLTAPESNEDLFYKVENLNNRFFVHHFRLRDVSDISAALTSSMKKAYSIGQRHHIKKRTSKK